MQARFICRQIVYEFQTRYRSTYVPVHDCICKTEVSDVNRLDHLVNGTTLAGEAPLQTTGDLYTLLQNAWVVKQFHYDPFFEHMQREAPRRLKFVASKLKGIWRCIERVELRTVTLESYASIYDIVRGFICSNRVAALADVYQQLLDAQVHGKIRIVRVKNRMKHANASGWADCVINFLFVDDQSKHICEVQLIHEKLVIARKNMGAYESYPFFRNALDLLETTDETRSWAQECALVDLYNKSNGPGWAKRKNWCSGAPMHKWEGVTVDEDKLISQLDFRGNSLRGTLILRCRPRTPLTSLRRPCLRIRTFLQSDTARP
jgi:hypothetical protein